MQETFIDTKTGTGLCLALLADVHNTEGTKALSSLARRRPQAILIAGDVIRGELPPEGCLKIESENQVLPFLQACRAVAPVFLSLGNHEWLLQEEDLSRIRGLGVEILDNCWKRVCLDGKEIVLGGLTAARVTGFRRYHEGHHPELPYVRWNREEREKDRTVPELDWLLEFESQPGLRVLLCHHPEYWTQYLRGRKIDLCLSGHAHGGQIRLLGRGLFAPGQGLLPRYTSGMYEGPRGKLIVTRGLANTAPVPRLFNPTQVVYLCC